MNGLFFIHVCGLLLPAGTSVKLQGYVFKTLVHCNTPQRSNVCGSQTFT